MVLPPPVANAAAQIALDNALDGNNQGTIRVQAGRAAKRAKVSMDFYSAGLLSTPENGDQFIYATTTAIAANPNGGLPPGAPAWAQALVVHLNARFDNMDARFDNMDARFDNMDARFANVDARFANVDARLANASATEPNDVLHPLSNIEGLIPPNFPYSLKNLFAMNNQAMAALLAHYQLPPGQIVDRARRLRRFLGVQF
jgi:hypothetical protein